MPNQDIAVYSFKVDREKLNQIRTIAQGEHRSLVQKLRLMIDQEIARNDAEKAAA